MTDPRIDKLLGLIDRFARLHADAVCEQQAGNYHPDVHDEAKQAKAEVEAAITEALDLGEPVAWWRWSDAERSDADVQIGRWKPTKQIMRNNGQEWTPLYAPKGQP